MKDIVEALGASVGIAVIGAMLFTSGKFVYQAHLMPAGVPVHVLEPDLYHYLAAGRGPVPTSPASNIVSPRVYVYTLDGTAVNPTPAAPAAAAARGGGVN